MGTAVLLMLLRLFRLRTIFQTWDNFSDLGHLMRLQPIFQTQDNFSDLGQFFKLGTIFPRFWFWPAEVKNWHFRFPICLDENGNFRPAIPPKHFRHFYIPFVCVSVSLSIYQKYRPVSKISFRVKIIIPSQKYFPESKTLSQVENIVPSWKHCPQLKTLSSQKHHPESKISSQVKNIIPSQKYCPSSKILSWV